jgi:hypothetical protein
MGEESSSLFKDCLDVEYADWHNSKVGIIVWFDDDSVLSACIFIISLIVF